MCLHEASIGVLNSACFVWVYARRGCVAAGIAYSTVLLDLLIAAALLAALLKQGPLGAAPMTPMQHRLCLWLMFEHCPHQQQHTIHACSLDHRYLVSEVLVMYKRQR